MLDRFRSAKQREIAALKELAGSGALPQEYSGLRQSFRNTLSKSRQAVIAEYKRASPSKGDINLEAGPEEIAKAYAEAGATAISVLTEEDYFKGDIHFLERMSGPGLPLLRKDFIFDPLQVVQTASTPASAFLLIVRMLDTATLRELIQKGKEYGLEAVVEIFNREDLGKAREAGAEIIQVNNRDLDTLKVDLALSFEMIKEKVPGEFWISASGIEKPEQLEKLLASGFDAALIGSSLMGGGKPGKALKRLMGGAHNG